MQRRPPDANGRIVSEHEDREAAGRLAETTTSCVGAHGISRQQCVRLGGACRGRARGVGTCSSATTALKNGTFMVCGRLVSYRAMRIA